MKYFICSTNTAMAGFHYRVLGTSHHVGGFGGMSCKIMTFEVKTLDFARNKLIIVMKILGGGGGDLGFGGISQSRLPPRMNP